MTACDSCGVRVAVVVLAILSAACRSSALQPPQTTPLPEPTPTAAPSASPSALAPTAVGAAPDAGVLLVAGEDDVIYRYDGGTGELRAVWRHADLTSATADGAYFEGCTSPPHLRAF